MITTPFKFLNYQKLSLLSDTSKQEHQKFAKNLKKEILKSLPKEKSNTYSESYTLKIENNGEEIQYQVLNWFSKLTQEDKIKVCTIQNKWLINILCQMYLLFIKDNKIAFEPSNEMICFFKSKLEKTENYAASNSLNSLNLLNYNNFSSNDEINYSNEKEGKEDSNAVNEIEGEEDFYKTYFIYTKTKKVIEDSDINMEEDFLKYIKLLSLEKDEFDTITIGLELLSDVEQFKRYFKFFTNDNYFKDWIYPFNKNGIENFYLPNWMSKTNLTFCQIIIGFLEQQILLNYEYFYYTNKIYEVSYNQKIINIYKEIENIEKYLNDNFNFNYFDDIFSKTIIQNEIDKIKNNKKYLELNTKLRNIYNKVYFDKFKYPMFDRNILYDSKLNLKIFQELQDSIKNIKDENSKIKKLIDNLTFLSFNKIINNRQYIYLSYKKYLFEYIYDESTNEIKEEDKNEKLQRIISKTSMSTYKSSNNLEEQISFSLDNSFSINGDISENNNQSYNNNCSNNNNSFINIQNNTNMNNNNCNNYNNDMNKIFSLYYYTYYDKGIMKYYSDTINNLTILNFFKSKYLNIVENIIKEKLKDKFDITFGHYGSYFTGLSIEGSDVDICIDFKPKKNNLNFYNELYNLLIKQKPLLYSITPNLCNGFTIIKLEIDITNEIRNNPLSYYFYLNYDEFTKIKIDISFSENDEEYFQNCLKTLKYVNESINKYKQIKPVILILKRYFKIINMNKVFYGGISSYSLFLITLNAIKSYEKDFPNTKLGISQLLILVLKKFSYFNFQNYGIGIDNLDYKLEYENEQENLFILNPINGKNVAKGRCKGNKLKNAFFNVYRLIYNESNNFRLFFNSGFNPFSGNPIYSLFNSSKNWKI